MFVFCDNLCLKELKIFALGDDSMKMMRGGSVYVMINVSAMYVSVRFYSLHTS